MLLRGAKEKKNAGKGTEEKNKMKKDALALRVMGTYDLNEKFCIENKIFY